MIRNFPNILSRSFCLRAAVSVIYLILIHKIATSCKHCWVN